MAAIISAISTVITAFVEWITELAGFIVDTPTVLFFVALGVISAVIGVLSRFIPLRGRRGRRR